MEFWNDEITDKSWQRLIEFRKEIDFVLIGGWAIYIYTKLQKSKDIDIIVDYPILRQLKADYRFNKNERLKKYEIKLEEGFDVDIYTPGYSKLTIPTKYIIENSVMHDGFKVPNQEILLLLKLGAFIDRKKSIKGGKDSIDILGLIFNADINFKHLKSLINEYKLENYLDVLLDILRDFDLSSVNYLKLNIHSFSKQKKKYKQIILDFL